MRLDHQEHSTPQICGRPGPSNCPDRKARHTHKRKQLLYGIEPARAAAPHLAVGVDSDKKALAKHSGERHRLAQYGVKADLHSPLGSQCLYHEGKKLERQKTSPDETEQRRSRTALLTLSAALTDMYDGSETVCGGENASAK